MASLLKKYIVFVYSVIAAIMLLVLPVFAERNFMIPDGLVSDFSGTLNPDDKQSILIALEQARVANGMDGHVIVSLSTEEWNLDEYAKDYADFLQGQGIITSTGWLMYLSTADRKFAVAVQDKAVESITPTRRKEIYLIMSGRLDQGDVVGGIIDGINAVANLDAPSVIREKRDMSPGMFVFTGVLIIVVVSFMRLRKTRMAQTAKT